MIKKESKPTMALLLATVICISMCSYSYGQTTESSTTNNNSGKESVKIIRVKEKSRYEWAVKTNLLYGAYAITPNLGFELGLKYNSTLDINSGYNWFNREGSKTNNKKSVHWLANIEYRYWLCRRFNGHFFGVHALGSQYNIGERNIPLIFGKESEMFRYEGWAAGAGISYGYQWILGLHWNLEANIGVGYAHLKYGKYNCKTCGNKLTSEKKNYFGPTKAGVSLIYLF